MKIYLPIHQPACGKEVFYGIDAFGFDNQMVVCHIEHLDDTRRTDIPFGDSRVETVAAEIIEPVHVELSADELVQEAFGVFVLKNLNGETEQIGRASCRER